MLRSRSWVKVTNTYGIDYSGSFRGRDRREAQELAAEWSDEIDEGRKIRELWQYLYSLYAPERADKILDDYELPRPPSRSRRTPE
jgi:hypothetical protein